jgi:hypothetical protein
MDYRWGLLFVSLLSSTYTLDLFAQGNLSFYTSPWQWNASITGTLSHVSFRNWADDGDNFSYLVGMKMNIDPTWSNNGWSFAGAWDGQFSTFGGNSIRPRKTSDRLELNAKFGRMLWKSDWFGSSLHVVLFSDLLTQFLRNFDDSDDPNGTNYTKNFMAPGSLTDGLGLDYRSDSLGLSIVLTPIASKQTIVLDNGVDGTTFGLDTNQHINSHPGAYAHIRLKKEIFPNTTLSIKSIFFADYSERSTVDLSFLGEVDYQVTSFLKLYVSLQMLNDDDMKISLYEDLDGDGNPDDFAGFSHELQLYGQLGVGINIDF